MGSWANSIHVRHDDAEAVAEAVHNLITSAPLRPEDFDDGDLDEDTLPPRRRRRVRVFRPSRGWVGILDNEDFSGLGMAISDRLGTDVLSILVNASDWWAYEPPRDGEAVDEFNSCGDINDEGVLSPELQAALERGDEEAAADLMERELLRHAPRGLVHFPGGAVAPPPELALLRDRIRGGRASFWERLRYWWRSLWYWFRVRTIRPDPFAYGFDIPRTAPLSAADLRRHVGHIREAFPHADERALRELLPQSRFPAEELLAKFLEIVGLPSLWAYLSFRYQADHGRAELEAAGIVRATDLRF